MIRVTCIEAPNNVYETYSVKQALWLIRSLKKSGYHVEWTCPDPEDNQYLWENS